MPTATPDPTMTDMPSFTICGRLATADTLFLDGNANGLTPYDVAVLKLNQNGNLRLVVDERNGGDGTPMDEWYGVVRTWTVRRGPAELDVAALRVDLEPGGHLYELMDRVSAGLDWGHDGRGNPCGTLTTDAAEAEEELDRHFEDADYDSGREVWDADEWLGSTKVKRLTADTTDEQLKVLIAMVELWAEGDGVLLMDTEQALARRRNDLRLERALEMEEALA